MISCLVGVFSVLAPGLSGSLIVAVIYRYFMGDSKGVLYVLFAAGGIAGYLVLAVSVGLLDGQGINPLIYCKFGAAGLLFSILLIWLLLRYRSRSAVSHGRSRRHIDLPHHNQEAVPPRGTLMISLAAVIVLASLLLALISSYISRTTPVFAWDAIHAWASWGRGFIDFYTDIYQPVGRERVEGEAFPYAHPRHPMTIVYLYAYAAQLQEQFLTFQGWLLPWAYMWVCAVIAVRAVISTVCRNRLVIETMTYMQLTLPLANEHFMLAGYIDSLIAIAVLVSVCVLSLSILLQHYRLMIVGGLFSLCPLMLKNTGAIYVMGILLPFILWGLWRFIPALIFALIASSSAVFLLMLWGGVEFSMLGLSIRAIGGLNLLVAFGGYEHLLSPNSASQVLDNALWSLFMNQSFSIAASVILLAFCLTVKPSRADGPNVRGAYCYTLSVTLGIILLFALPQFSEEYSRVYADRYSDTGNSRFILPAFMTSLLLLPYWCRWACIPWLRTSLATSGSACGSSGA